MKRMIMTVMILSALLASALTGCGNDNIDTASTPEIAVTTTEAVTETTTEATETTSDSSESVEDAQATATEAEQATNPPAETPEAPVAATEKPVEASETSDVLSEAQMKEASKKLIQEYVNLYDGMVCGSVQVDTNDVYNPEPAYTYFHVTDSRYQSIADLKTALANTLSGSEYDKMIKIMLEDTVPIYVEQEGKLYALSVGRGSAYSDTWCWDELQFTNLTANSFTVTAKYIHIADTVITQSFDIVNTEGGFRISKAYETQLS